MSGSVSGEPEMCCDNCGMRQRLKWATWWLMLLAVVVNQCAYWSQRQTVSYWVATAEKQNRTLKLQDETMQLQDQTITQLRAAIEEQDRALRDADTVVNEARAAMSNQNKAALKLLGAFTETLQPVNPPFNSPRLQSKKQ